ncbi:MAG TPA: LptA/OstA family protein [Terriglobales bacterium]|nr:LptA/OstA family protein [Terriglobales bacterium]
MPLDTRRLRMWFALAIGLLLLVVLGFYGRSYYKRYLLAKIIQKKANKLGLDIQQSTDNFTLSKSEGGHTLFTIRASKAVQVTSGHAELHDVNIVVYGQQNNRFDQIYGSEFEFDPKTGDVSATGEVHIDLQGVAEGGQRPDQAPPKELNNPIHLMTSGLVFNRNTGIASTAQRIEFRIPQASGSAVGATFDSKAGQLKLHSRIEIENSGQNAGRLSADSGVISKDPTQVQFTGAHISRESNDITARQLTVVLREDNSIEKMFAQGDVTAQMKGKSEARVVAPRADITMGPKNKIIAAKMSGGVTIDSAGDQPMHGTAGRVVLDFGANNRLSKVHALENVKFTQEPPKNKPQGQTVVLTSQALDFDANQSGRRAETKGPAQITITAVQGENAGSTIATADRFIASFDRNGKLSTLVGSPNAKVVSSTPGQPDKITTSNTLTLAMKPDGGLSNIVQEGSFHYTEAPSKSGQTGTDATATKATYDPQTEMFVLTGSPRLTDSGVTIAADHMRINRKTGDANAEGSVKTTYSQLQPQPNGALLATSDPIHVTAASMTARKSNDTAHYSGGARLWQGANIVEAPTIDFDRNARTVTAIGQPRKQVSTVFVEQGQNGKQTPVSVTGSRLTYADSQRQAKFEGGVVMRSAEGTVTADHVTVFLQPRGQTSTSTAAKAASELEKVVAEGNVVIQQEGRRGTGRTLTYLAKNGRFVLTGNSPSIFDAEHGKVTGDSLTFFSHDDRVLVEGGKTAPSVTKARVIK